MDRPFTQAEADYYATKEPMPLWCALLLAFLIGAFLAFVAWQLVENLPAVLDFLSPDRHTTLEQAIARMEAKP